MNTFEKGCRVGAVVFMGIIGLEFCALGNQLAAQTRMIAPGVAWAGKPWFRGHAVVCHNSVPSPSRVAVNQRS